MLTYKIAVVQIPCTLALIAQQCSGLKLKLIESASGQQLDWFHTVYIYGHFA